MLTLRRLQLFLYGLIIQLISFIIYTLIFALFVYRLKTQRTKEWYNRPNGLYGHWLALVYVLVISCIGILVSQSFDPLGARSHRVVCHRSVRYSERLRTHKGSTEHSPRPRGISTCWTVSLSG